jgi:hypothetical protein
MEEPERFKILDEEKKEWGKLVKAWAKHEKPWPRNKEELLVQCANAGVHPVVPDFVLGVVFIQNDKQLVTVRLPPKDLVEAGEQFVAGQPGAYPLPPFYSDFFIEPRQRSDLSAAKRLELHDSRVGEYAVNSCA